MSSTFVILEHTKSALDDDINYKWNPVDLNSSIFEVESLTSCQISVKS